MGDCCNFEDPEITLSRKQTMSFKEYVLGFAFTPDRRWVVLINKTKPEGQKGKLNGVGGKIEVGETPLDAMRREFHEEVDVIHSDWRHYTTMKFTNSCVYVFETTFLPPNDWCGGTLNTSVMLALETPYQSWKKGSETLPYVKRRGWPTEEIPCIANVQNLPENVMTNLRWLIPMACDVGFKQPLDVTYNEDNDK